jgi:hypothetical protein
MINEANRILSDIQPGTTSLADFLGDTRLRFELYTEPGTPTDQYGGIWYWNSQSEYNAAVTSGRIKF